MLVLAYRKCSTCIKALKWLGENGVIYEERAIVEQNPTKEELKEWYKMSGLPLKKFFNTSGNMYKEHQLKDKLPNMTEDEQLALLAQSGMLVKRPLVIGDDFVLTGFREAEWQDKLLKKENKNADTKETEDMVMHVSTHRGSLLNSLE